MAPGRATAEQDWVTRRAGPGEAAALAALGARLFREAFAAENTPQDMARYLAEHFTPEAMQAVLGDRASTVLMLEQAGGSAGWAQLVDDGGALEIRRFYVDPRWQGGGAAVALMSAVLGEARVRGKERIWLAVWEHNRRARAFYAKHGFRKVGSQPFRLGSDVQTDEVHSRPLSFGLTLAIVAGGRARRLGGVAKPLLRVGGRTILQRLLELRTLCDQVLLVSGDDRLVAPGSERIADVLQDRGAPGGVHAALLAASRPWVLAVAGDMPFLDGRAVGPLLEARAEGVEAVAYEVEGRLEPLAALYRASLGPRWGELLASEGRSFRALWERCAGRRLDASVLACRCGAAGAAQSQHRGRRGDVGRCTTSTFTLRQEFRPGRDVAPSAEPLLPFPGVTSASRAMTKPFDRAVSGFNHNITHGGRAFHVQTEDSGVNNPNIITHVFVGGNILASKKTSYAEVLKAENLQELVRQLMETQHKQMLRNVVNGTYDNVDSVARSYQPGQLAPEEGKRAAASTKGRPTASVPPEVAAARELPVPPELNEVGAQTLFGEDLISEKSLDEVIMAYLSEESADD